MWIMAALIGGVMSILAIVFSLAKVSTRAEEITEKHREELFERKLKQEENDEEHDGKKKDEKNPDELN